MAEEEKKGTEETGETGETSVPPVPPAEADAQSEAEAPAEPEQQAAEESTAEDKPAEPEKPAEPDWKALYALTLADFDNYKKRAARDREDTFRFAEMDILKDVLPAVDKLELALSNAKEKAEDPFVKGVQLVYDTLLKSLKDHGAEPFESVGKDLDTAKMEAIATLPSPDVPEGKVSIESKKGWMLKDKVLRAAQVVVSSGKPE
jgi:molecular chaperone GrpE